MRSHLFVQRLTKGLLLVVLTFIAYGSPTLLLAADHWAYQPLSTDAPPDADHPWIHNPIDQFVWQQLQQAGIEPSPSADTATLVKRLYYDLLGLTPHYADVEALTNDPSEEAYASLVDRLLSTEHFAERWARHWLDVARYADSDGYEKDTNRPNAWRYRDWVIDAIHRDMPFDQFTVEQLAGDMLPNKTADQILATAFHRQTLTNTEGGTDQEQWRVAAVMDRTETLGTAWLGLTVGCARCHDHKYDDLTQQEYYQLFSYFNNGDEINSKIARSKEAYQKYETAIQDYEQKFAQLKATVDQTEAEARGRQATMEQSLKGQLTAATNDPLIVHPVEIVSASATSGQTFQTLDDGSLLAEKPGSSKDTYTVTVRAPTKQFRRLRVEVLPHESLPKQGPGLATNGNLVLSELRSFRGDKVAGDQLPLVAIRADFSQEKWHVSQATDGDSKSGWGVHPKESQPHEAVFSSEELIDLGDERTVTIELDQQHNNHSIGRFRLSVVTGTDPEEILPASLQDALALEPASRDTKTAQTLSDHLVTLDSAFAAISQQLKELEASAPQPPLMKVRVIGERQKDRRTSHILHRGEFKQPGEEVVSNTPVTLPMIEPRSGDASDRLDLAQWLVNGHNPLVPRVAVNQIWHHLFGHGIVRTLNDFGIQGEGPTHPEMLDWLAAEYVRLGWSRKTLIKLIVTSSTYRQASHHRPNLADIDPTNRLLYRQNRFRVEAETVRDLYLSAAGLLSSKVGGPSVFPPIPKGATAVNYNSAFGWKVSNGDNRYRRGMYTFFKRTAPHPNLMTLDCPDSNVTCVQRTRSNTPLAALITLNNEVFHEAAQALARRILSSQSKSDEERLDLAYRLCLARSPDRDEQTELSKLLEISRKWYQQNEKSADQLVGNYGVPDLANTEMASWIATTRIVLNTDQFITRE